MKNTAGMRVVTAAPKMTERVELPGGQDRLRSLVIYVSAKCEQAERFGLVKLNKILWKADFESYADRGRPVTGRPYQRLPEGPAPREMPRILSDLNRDQIIWFDFTDFGDGIIEQRPRTTTRFNPGDLTPADMRYVDAAIEHYWDKTGREASDDSHGIAWEVQNNGEPMFYELARLSPVTPSFQQLDSIAYGCRKRLNRN
jgi:hypothetical protein